MQKSFLKILNAEQQEANQVFLLLTKGFCMGTFLATFEVAASTLFLNHFDEQKDLPLAFIVSGILAVVATYLFNYFQSRIPFSRVATGLIAVVVVCVLGLRIGFSLLDSIRPIVFLSFTLITPFNLIILLVFWGIFGRIFNAKQSKRIVSGIDVGQLTASIIALFTIPFVLSLIGSTQNLFWIGAISVFCDLILTVIISATFDLGVKTKDLTVDHYVSYKALFTDRYLLLMSAFVIVSVTGVFFIDYSFLSVVAAQFPDTKDLANFISIFSGTIVFFIFFFQTFITNRIITEYGLGFSLLITPFLLGLFTILAILTGSIFGYTNISPAFVFFFLIIALSKLFTKSLKDALDTPVFKLCFLPLSATIRFDIQAKIEGVVLAFAGLLAGSLQVIINLTAVFELIHYSFFLLPITIAWMVIAQKLHVKYKEAIQNTLSNTKSGNEIKGYKNWFSPSLLLKDLLIKCKDENTSLYLVKIIAKIAPDVLHENILNKIPHASSKLKTLIQKKIEPDIEPTKVESVYEKPLLIDQEISVSSIKAQLPFSNKPEKLALSILLGDSKELFEGVKRKESLILLVNLLHDPDPEIRKAGMVAASKSHVPETWPFILEQLSTSVYHKTAMETFVKIGEEALPMLDNTFYKLKQDNALLSSILKIYKLIGGKNAINLLWNKLDFPNQKISQEALHNFSLAVLNDNSYHIKGEKAAKIYNLIEEEVGKAAWNLAAKSEILNDSYYADLNLAIQEELQINLETIYLLLSLMYDPYSVQLVRENIESDTVEGTAFALELMNIFLATELKKILFPLMDDLPASQKIHILQEHFPRAKFNSVEVLIEIINRDYNKIHRWTKATALNAIAGNDLIAITDDIKAQVFNPDPLLREMATWVICKKDKVLTLKDSPTFLRLSPRLNDTVKAELEWLFNYAYPNGDKPPRVARVDFLKKISPISQLPTNVLLEVAELMKERRFRSGEKIISKKEDTNLPVCLIKTGTVSITDEEYEIAQLGERGAFGFDEDSLTNKSLYDIYAKKYTIIYEIDKNRLYEIAMRDYRIIQVLIQAQTELLISSRFETEMLLKDN